MAVTAATVGSNATMESANRPPVPLFFVVVRDEACGVEFYAPPDWDVAFERVFGGNTVAEPECVIRLRDPGWRAKAQASDLSLPDYPLTIRVSTHDCNKVAQRTRFLGDDGVWRGERIKTECCFFFNGNTEVRTHYKRGGYAGLGTALVGYLSNGKGRCASFDGEFGLDHFDFIIRGFRLLAPAKAPAAP